MNKFKSVPVSFNGKKLCQMYPHATWFQVLKWKIKRFIRKVIILTIFAGMIALIIFIVIQFRNASTVDINSDSSPKVEQATDNELESIMNEESFKKITILRARKVSNDNKKNIEEARHETTMNSIESEYESIRAEELALVGNTTSLK